MRRTNLHTLPILLLALVAAAAWAASPVKNAGDWDARAKKNKAESMLLESTSAMSADRLDDYFLLTRRAYMLDSNDIDNEYAWNTLMMNFVEDSAIVEKGFQSYKHRFITDPSNYELGLMFANLCRHMRRFDDYQRTWEMLDSAFPALSQPSEELAGAYLISSLMGDSAAYDKALAIYKRLESAQGRNIGLSSQKIRAFTSKGDTASILQEVDSLLAFAPKDPYVALFAGSNYQNLGNYDDALKYYSLACELDSTIGTAYMAKAGVYQQIGDSVAYDREVFRALSSQNLEVEPKLEILRRYVSGLYKDLSQESRIRRTFTDLEQMHSGTPEIHVLYSSYLYEIKDYKGAADEMSFAVALDPAQEGNWVSLMQLSALAKDSADLIARAKDAMLRFPDNLYFPIVVASSFQESERYKEALDFMETVNLDSITVNSPAAVANFISYKGDLYSLIGDTVTALEKYNEALELDPDNHLALNNAAYFMAEHDMDLDKAEQYSVKAVRDNPDNPTYLDTYAWVLFKKKDYSLAKQYIDMTLNLYNTTMAADSADSSAVIIDTTAEDAKVEESTEVVEEYLMEDQMEEEQETPHSEIYDHAGDIYFFNGERDKAVDFWKKALELDPENATIGMKVKHRTYFYKD